MPIGDQAWTVVERDDVATYLKSINIYLARIAVAQERIANALDPQGEHIEDCTP